MSDSATADATYYSHTLTNRPATPPLHPRDLDPRLPLITARLLSLPPEIRSRIYALVFAHNRVAVTCRSGCYCASTATGRYRAEHRWLLHQASGEVRMDAQRWFMREVLWEVHCEAAWRGFVAKVREVGAEGWVRHVRVNVFETSREPWVVRTGELVGLRSVTFCPWQKGWTLDVPAVEGEVELRDERMMERVREILRTKAGYEWVWEMVGLGREKRGGWKIYFLFPVRYMYEIVGVRRRWLLKVWRADLDKNVIDRRWKELHLVQEATLD